MTKVILSVLFVVAACTFASAAQFDINYFNGVKWGSNISASDGFKLTGSGTLGAKYYSRAADKLLFEGIQVNEITYAVNNGRFTDAIVAFNGDDSKNKIHSVLVRKFKTFERLGNGLEEFLFHNGKRFVKAVYQYRNGSGLINFHFASEADVNKALKSIESMNK